MYAIVEIAGQQFKVAKDQKVYVHRLQNEEGSNVTFDNVLLLEDGSNITIGAPAIDGATVEAKVIKHLKGDKVIVFKKKRRKGYKVRNGHRQYLTELVIESIVASGAKKAAPKKETAPKKAAPKKEVATKAAAPKKAAPKKSAKADDLKKVEGIGPKAAEALVNAGIDTFVKLSKAKPAKIKEILTAASSNMAHLEPGSWPKQAKMAAEGNWDELKEWQDNHKGGIE